MRTHLPTALPTRGHRLQLQDLQLLGQSILRVKAETSVPKNFKFVLRLLSLRLR